ncbi:MAG: vWA domain-containing protein, partial [Gammaproteobacteria bacterium]
MFEFFFKYSSTTFKSAEFFFASSWPVWLLATLCILAAVLVGFGLAQSKESLKISRLLMLGTLQTAVVAIVLTLLWKPTLSTEQLRAHENSVAVLVDASESMSYGSDEESRLQQAVMALNGDVIDNLRDIVELQLYAFSRDSISIESLEDVPPPGPATHIGDALLDVLRGAGSSALGAVILVSDGADNSRDFDTARLAEIVGFGVPVHTVGVGREHIPEDVELESVTISPQVLPGARVSAQVSIRHAGV